MTVSAEIAYEIDAPYAQPHAREVYAEQPCLIRRNCRRTWSLRRICARWRRRSSGTRQTPCSRRAKIYDFITTQAVYRFMPPYLTVPNIPEYFLSGLRGDCGVQAITFVTLCVCAAFRLNGRAACIPSRTARVITIGRGFMSRRSAGCLRIARSAAQPIARAIWIAGISISAILNRGACRRAARSSRSSTRRADFCGMIRMTTRAARSRA